MKKKNAITTLFYFFLMSLPFFWGGCGSSDDNSEEGVTFTSRKTIRNDSLGTVSTWVKKQNKKGTIIKEFLNCDYSMDECDSTHLTLEQWTKNDKGYCKRYENGRLTSLDIIENSEFDGTTFFFHKNGRIKQTSYTKHGKTYGIQRYYLDDGTLKCVYCFEKGKVYYKNNYKIKDGIRIDSTLEVIPLIINKKDTVNAGEPFTIYFRRPECSYMANSKDTFEIMLAIEEWKLSDKYPTLMPLKSSILLENKSKATGVEARLLLPKTRYFIQGEVYKNGQFLNNFGHDVIYTR